jgi:N-acetylmuramoyl-L-alanine amidase
MSALAQDPVGGDLLVRLPEGRGERVMRSQVLDGGEGRAEYLAAGDVAELLRATSYWRSETRKLLLRMGDHRLTATVDNPFVILDGEVTRLPAAPRYQNGQVWLPLVTFDLLEEGDVVPESSWDAEHRVLSLGGEAEEAESAAELARRRDRLLAGDSTGSQGPSRPALVVLDPGHGGEDTGCVAGGLEEKHLTLELATRIRRHLAAAGFRTVLVRERDERVEVPRRVEIANSSRADLLVSLHFDLTAGGSRRVRLAVRPGSGQVVFEDLARFTPGTVAASNTPESLDLVRWSTAGARFGVESYRMAQQIAGRIEDGPALDAEVVERPVWNLEGAQMPAVAIEVGAPAGGAVGRGEVLEGLASAVADGLVRYWWGGGSR